MRIDVLNEILSDPKYKICSFAGKECNGNISFEHALIFAGSKIDEKFAIIPICHRHHSIGIWQDKGLLNKEKNVWVALNQMSDDELARYSKAQDLFAMKDFLNEKYDKKKT